MSNKIYYITVSTLFLVIGAMHFARLLFGWEAIIGNVPVPMWFSWFAVVLTFYLSARGFTFVARSTK